MQNSFAASGMKNTTHSKSGRAITAPSSAFVLYGPVCIIENYQFIVPLNTTVFTHVAISCPISLFNTNHDEKFSTPIMATRPSQVNLHLCHDTVGKQMWSQCKSCDHQYIYYTHLLTSPFQIFFLWA